MPVEAGQLTISGKFALRTRSGRRSYSGKLDGTIRFDPETGAWTRVRLLADGVASGAGTYTPNQPKQPYRLLVGVLDTTLPEARIVPPEEVATQKMPDLTAADMDAAVRTLAGSARSAGLNVEGVV